MSSAKTHQYAWIARTLLKSPLSWVPLNWVEIWAAAFATQHLSELILTWEWELCSCGNFHAEFTQTGQLSRLNCWVVFLQSALRWQIVSKRLRGLTAQFLMISGNRWHRCCEGSVRYYPDWWQLHEYRQGGDVGPQCLRQHRKVPSVSADSQRRCSHRCIPRSLLHPGLLIATGLQ